VVLERRWSQVSGGHGEKRSRREDAAIAALLVCPTIAAAATRAGIGEATLRRWLDDPPFAARYRAARRQVVEQATAQLQQATSEAVDTLRRNLRSGTPAAEIAAARAVIAFSIKAVELVDLVERVDQLERLAAEAAEEKRR
jgi:hypothetical protein